MLTEIIMCLWVMIMMLGCWIEISKVKEKDKIVWG